MDKEPYVPRTARLAYRRRGKAKVWSKPVILIIAGNLLFHLLVYLFILLYN